MELVGYPEYKMWLTLSVCPVTNFTQRGGRTSAVLLKQIE